MDDFLFCYITVPFISTLGTINSEIFTISTNSMEEGVIMAIESPLLVALEIVYRAIYPSLLSTPNTINAIKEFLKENPQYNEIAVEIATLANTAMSNKIKSHNHSSE